MSKHLMLSDRAIIEKYLALDVSFAYIARHLNRSATTKKTPQRASYRRFSVS
ncbi:MAG: helix-turn-helix domain-containing protein [Clostridia bacterium]|nr:helix-turn-helix domain-containing protein [Clostridia bacterium]